jgi:predicted site-specific integrase-resolvase
MNDNKDTKFISIREAIIISGIGAQTLRKLCDNEKIICYKTLSGQRKINKFSLEQMCNNVPTNVKTLSDKRENFIYARVSSKKQMDDLSRQLEFITSRNKNYVTYKSITDIASGINFKRKGMQTILESALQGNIGEVVIAHKDRLSRSAFDLLQFIIERAGGKIIILDDEKNKTSEQELAEELLSIIHVYSCKENGKRRYKSKSNESDSD